MQAFARKIAMLSIGTIPISYWHLKQAEAAPSPCYISKKELEKHNNIKTGIWVSYKNEVYDVTNFVENHPGGKNRILMAAGRAIDPFWCIYQQHLTPPILNLLSEYKIGELDPSEIKPINSDKIYVNEPVRHPALKVHKEKPFNAETPLTLLRDHWVTPANLHYVRNHMPVPQDYKDITLDGQVISIKDLIKSFPSKEITVTLQCGGNRRNELSKIESTQGLPWGAGTISTSIWKGISLKDILEKKGYSSDDKKYVCFSGSDKGFDASITLEHAMNPSKDVILAYEMNGEAIPPDHGRPLRLIVPGVIGARNVKWVKDIEISDQPAPGNWQQGPAYKMYPPEIKDVQQANKVLDAQAVYEMPVQSIITNIEEDEVKGIAWSGGGRKIIRVEVSSDGGQSWSTATLEEPGKSQPSGKAWAWTFWSIEIENSGNVCCRAIDESGNCQPEKPEQVWNFRGILNNCWHCLTPQ